MVLFGFAGEISKIALEMVSRAERRSENFLAFVKDLHYLSSLRTEGIERKRKVSISKILKETIEKINPSIEERKIILNTNIPGNDIMIDADPEAMEKLFFNLIQNAVNYTLPGGKVELLIKETHEDETIASGEKKEE
ncbi:MAG: hypothetical protein DRP87_04175 [Spirochaetes bacterium]|nr:MAG: hypothetical protein DRP87_04175 [Spirochaetota bacterium]